MAATGIERIEDVTLPAAQDEVPGHAPLPSLRPRVRAWSSAYETALYWGLLALVLLAPLPFGGARPLPENLLLAGVGLLALLWGLGLLRGGVRHAVPLRAIGAIALPFGLVLAWVAVQAVPWTPAGLHHPYWVPAGELLDVPVAAAISLNPDHTWAGFSWLLGHGVVFWLALQLCRPPERASRALLALALAGLAYAAYGLAGAGAVLAEGGVVTSTFVDPDHYATFAGLTLLCALGVLTAALLRPAREDARWRGPLAALLSRRGRGLLLGGLATLVIGGALLLSHSRGGVLATLAALLILLAALGAHRAPARFAYPALVVGLLVIVALFLELSGGAAAQRLEAGAAVGDQRAALLAPTMQAIAERPLLGSGYGTAAEALRAYGHEGLAGVDLGTAYNSYLRSTLELGLPATLLLLLALGFASLRCLAGLRRRQRQQSTLAVALAASVLVAGLALVGVGPGSQGVAAVYALLLGIGCAQSWRSREEPG